MGKTRKICLTILCLAATAATAPYAWAQPTPEVQIDASVLQELAPAAGTAHSRPALSRPAARPSQVLISGGAQQQQYQQYHQKYQQAPPAAYRPTQHRIVPMPPPQAVAGQQPIDPSKPYAVRRTRSIQPIVQSFPVRTTVRSDSSNPAGFGLTKPAGSAVPPSMITPREVTSAPGLPPAPAEASPAGVATFSRKIPIFQAPPTVTALGRPNVVMGTSKVSPPPERQRTAFKPKADKARTAKASIPPIPARKPRSEMVITSSKVAPVPERRPAAIAKAAPKTQQGVITPQSQEMIAATTKAENAAKTVTPVAAAKAAAIAAVSPGGLPPSKLAAPPRPGRMAASVAGSLPNAPKVMPAVPTRAVGAEELPAVPGIAVADANDPLLLRLKDFDRQQFIKQVEGITAGIMPVPPRKPERGMPPGLDKTNLAVLTPRADMTKAIPVPQKIAEAALNQTEEAELIDVTARLAAMEPAAGGEIFASKPIDRKPRPPVENATHESAFITVPFMPGDEKPSAANIKRLEAEVIPLLKANPGWRVQIQAFSSPDNEVRSSARRTALTRALSVREYLMTKGIDAPRMDIRALGMETDRDPLDRIDLIFFDPAKNS